MARAPDGIKAIGQDNIDTIRYQSEHQVLRCPNCNHRVMLKAGGIRRWHFAHFSTGEARHCLAHYGEYETPEHIRMKQAVAKHLQVTYPEARVTYEAWIRETNQRADVLFERDATCSVFEVQRQPLSGKEWRERHSSYRSVHLHDIWMLYHQRVQVHPRNISHVSPQNERELAEVGATPVEVTLDRLSRVLVIEQKQLLLLNADDEPPQCIYLFDFDLTQMRRSNTVSCKQVICLLADTRLQQHHLVYPPLEAALLERDKQREQAKTSIPIRPPALHEAEDVREPSRGHSEYRHHQQTITREQRSKTRRVLSDRIHQHIGQLPGPRRLLYEKIYQELREQRASELLTLKEVWAALPQWHLLQKQYTITHFAIQRLLPLCDVPTPGWVYFRCHSIVWHAYIYYHCIHQQPVGTPITLSKVYALFAQVHKELLNDTISIAVNQIYKPIRRYLEYLADIGLLQHVQIDDQPQILRRSPLIGHASSMRKPA